MGCAELYKGIVAFIHAHEGVLGLLAIAFILHMPADLPRLVSFKPRDGVRYFGDWFRWWYGWLRDSLQAYVNRPAPKDSK